MVKENLVTPAKRMAEGISLQEEGSIPENEAKAAKFETPHQLIMHEMETNHTELERPTVPHEPNTSSKTGGEHIICVEKMDDPTTTRSEDANDTTIDIHREAEVYTICAETERKIIQDAYDLVKTIMHLFTRADELENRKKVLHPQLEYRIDAMREVVISCLHLSTHG